MLSIRLWLGALILMLTACGGPAPEEPLEPAAPTEESKTEDDIKDSPSEETQEPTK